MHPLIWIKTTALRLSPPSRHTPATIWSWHPSIPAVSGFQTPTYSRNKSIEKLFEKPKHSTFLKFQSGLSKWSYTSGKLTVL